MQASRTVRSIQNIQKFSFWLLRQRIVGSDIEILCQKLKGARMNSHLHIVV